jgi:hypothetical protein
MERYHLRAATTPAHLAPLMVSFKRRVSKVIAKVFDVRINVCLKSRSILYFMFMQIFMLFSNVVQSILFMNEFFAAFMAFYNWMVVDVS